MLDIIKGQFTDTMSLEEKVHLTRECLQILLLKILYDIGMFKKLAFVGGTALRIVFNLRRFSEDIDFSLIEKKGYSFDKLADSLSKQLYKYGLDVDSKEKKERIVHSIMYKFNHILYDLGLSNFKSEKLSIKLETDTNPPLGFRTEMSLINKFYVFTVTHCDLPSLYATKLHACFYRKYTKGRDFYDLVWYLGKGVSPNWVLLNNAIRQTEGKDLNITKENLKEFLKHKLSKIDFAVVRKDVDRFLVDKEELKLLDKDVITQIIK